MDDLHDGADPYNALCRIKEAVPDFKVTMFAIPTRCGDTLRTKYMKECEWVALAMHGWRHTLGECLSWNPYEAEWKIMRGIADGYENAFRAPRWMTTPAIYEVCKELEMPVADHTDHCYAVEGCKTYTYNDPSLPYKTFHLHADDGARVQGDTVTGAAQSLIDYFTARPAPFLWVNEAAT